MKKIIFFAAAAMLCNVASAGQKQLLNFGWKFHAGEAENAEVLAYDEAGWRTLDLPHDFQFEQAWDRNAGGARGFKAMGSGWYRKAFAADEAWKGKRILLDFEGIMLVGDVWFNGVKVGGTDYGYLGFEVDVTKLVSYDRNNLIAVRASTGETKNSRWYTGGGLYRDVHLLVKDSIAIARHGVFISTPVVSAQNAELAVQVELEGIRGRKTADVELEVKIFSPDGKLLTIASQTAPVKSKKRTDEVEIPTLSIASPELWDCQSPTLYSAEVTVSVGGNIVDRVTEKFGIRQLEFSPEFGFRLNGKKVILKGISNHHDLGAVGVAAHEQAIERQMETLKSFGFNHIRTSHNPYSESFLRLADKHGILIVDELFDKWSTQYAGGRKDWQLLWPTAITEWIKRDRNHPSVVMWSLGNELQVQEAWAGLQTGDWGVTTYRILDILVKRYDPTRKTTVGMFPARKNAMTKEDPDFNIKVESPELALVTDVASYNYRYPSFPDYAAKNPHLIFYQSEAATNEMGKAFYGMDLDKVVGLAYWGAIEYWGESNGWPRKGWNFSYFDHTYEPFPQAYFMKSMFSEAPTVYIGVIDSKRDTLEWNDVIVGRLPISSHWNRNANSSLNLVTYTNAYDVELLVNGKSQGVQKNDKTSSATRNAIFWKNIPYADGKVTAIARDEQGKELIRHELETTGKAVALRLTPENSSWKADGMSLQYVKVSAVDSKGRVVPMATGEVTFDVSGAATLLAVDNGNHASDELFNTNKRQLHNGKALAILRSTQAAGEAKLKVSANGLKAAELKITVK